jgi:hypothetical protein
MKHSSPLIIDSPQDLANALNGQLKLGLTARPWNLYSPAESLWWLVPSTDWPAYRYGKLAFSLAKDVPRKDLLSLNDPVLASDQMFVGFNLEKGYGPEAAVVNPALRRKPAQFVDPSWLWFEVVDVPGARRFGETLSKAASKAEIYLYIVASYVHDREAEAHSEHDAIMFKCTAAGLEPTLHRLSVGVLSGAERASTFTVLAERLRQVDNYHWVDIYAGTHTLKGEVDLVGLHDRVLSYFDVWLR